MDRKRTYTITGATGHIGNRVAQGLLQAGHHVRALGRDATRLQPLTDLGAVPFVGNWQDVDFIAEAFRGADAALLMAQGNITARDYRGAFAQVGANFANAARTTGLKSAVFISSIGAQDDRNRGLILIHGDVENHLNEVPDLNVVHLRAPFFFANLFYFLQPMRTRGVLSSPIAPNTPIDAGSTRDVAEAALRLLLEPEFHGKSAVELYGQPGLTMQVISDLIGKELGQSFPAEKTDRDADIEGMVAAGFGRDFAILMNDTWDSFNRSRLREENPTPENRMPSRIEDFIREELAPAILAPPPTVSPSKMPL
jgi:uncharacterized protein YbjT (DUF2867 family)